MAKEDKPPSGRYIEWLGQDSWPSQKIAADPGCTLEERLEAFEDIMDSEVGDTTIVRARHIERAFAIRQVYIKFEGSNPTGTQKDRIAFIQCMDALRRGFDTITVATCGNYGVAMSLAAGAAGLSCEIFIPETYHTSRIKEMESMGSRIHRVKGGYEEAVQASIDLSQQREWYDGNPGGNNTVLQLQAYGEIAFEIYDDLRDAPHSVAVPVSNGTVLAGIFKGFNRLFRKGKISRVPHMIAGSSYKQNPIIESINGNKMAYEQLDPLQIKESPINEPLINWHSLDGEWALEAIQKSKGYAQGFTDKKLQYYAKVLREKEGIQVMPAATAGLAALLDKHLHEPLPNDRYVVVLTARKS